MEKDYKKPYFYMVSCKFSDFYILFLLIKSMKNISGDHNELSFMKTIGKIEAEK